MDSNWTGERLEPFVLNDAAIEHLHRYAIAAEWVKGKEVLDIACGEGYGSHLLAQTAANVTGADIDETAVLRASAKYKKDNLRFLRAAVESIPLPDQSMDIIVSFETLEHTSQQEEMMREIKRVLKPAGILIISTPDKKNYSDIPRYKNPHHLKELYEDEFVRLIGQYFTHHYCLYQRAVFASVTLLKMSNGIEVFEGDYSAVRKIPSIDPVYLVAIASDADLPSPASSIFAGNLIFQQALEHEKKALKNTITYKTGHILLYPLKWFRNLFIKKIPSSNG